MPLISRFLSRAAACGLLVLLAAGSAHAAGWAAALRDAPLRDFSDEDITQHLAAVRKALDSDDPKAVVEWRSEATGAGARIRITGQPKLKGYAICKRVSSVSFSKRRKGTDTPFTACKNADGRWVVAG